MGRASDCTVVLPFVLPVNRITRFRLRVQPQFTHLQVSILVSLCNRAFVYKDGLIWCLICEMGLAHSNVCVQEPVCGCVDAEYMELAAALTDWGFV